MPRTAPGLYRTSEIREMRDLREQARNDKAAEKELKAAKAAADNDSEAAEKRQEVRRNEPANKVLEQVQEQVEAS